MSALARTLRQVLADSAGRWPKAMFGALDDNAERLARARAQGFDTDNIYYHGTNRVIDEGFRPNAKRPWDGTYLTRDRARANLYADGDNGAAVYPVYVKRGRRASEAQSQSLLQQSERVAKERVPSGEPGWLHQEYDAALNDEYRRRMRGFIGVSAHDNLQVLRPNDMRSIFAQFDPARTDSSDLLAGLAVGLPVGGLTLRELLRQRYEEEA